jgi:hypothetical protein
MNLQPINGQTTKLAALRGGLNHRHHFVGKPKQSCYLFLPWPLVIDPFFLPILLFSGLFICILLTISSSLSFALHFVFLFYFLFSFFFYLFFLSCTLFFSWFRFRHSLLVYSLFLLPSCSAATAIKNGGGRVLAASKDKRDINTCTRVQPAEAEQGASRGSGVPVVPHNPRRRNRHAENSELRGGLK